MSVPGGYPGAGPHASGPHPIGANPSGPVPTGANPFGPNPSGPLPTGANPSGPLPTGRHAAGTFGGWGSANSEQNTGPIPRVTGDWPSPGSGPGSGSGSGSAWAGASAAATPSASQAHSGLDPARLLGLAVAILGALNFVFGFLPELTATRSKESLSVFAVGPAYVPILLLIAGLLALAAFLPGSERSGSERSRLAVAAVSVGGAAGAIVSLGTAGPVQLVATTQVGKGLGAILLVVFGIVQAVVAIGAYVIGADFSQATKRAPSPTGLYPAAVPASVPASGPGPGAVSPGSIQPGWFGPAAGAAPTGYPVGYEQGYLQQAGPAPDDSATGPQVVVGPASTPDPRRERPVGPTDPSDSGGPDNSSDTGDAGAPTEGDRPPAIDLSKP